MLNIDFRVPKVADICTQELLAFGFFLMVVEWWLRSQPISPLQSTSSWGKLLSEWFVTRLNPATFYTTKNWITSYVISCGIPSVGRHVALVNSWSYLFRGWHHPTFWMQYFSKKHAREWEPLAVRFAWNTWGRSRYWWCQHGCDCLLSRDPKVTHESMYTQKIDTDASEKNTRDSCVLDVTLMCTWHDVVCVYK